MKTFKIRTQGASNGLLHSPKQVRWCEIDTEDMIIRFEGSHTQHTLVITVQANGVIYQLTDVLLEVALGRLAEEFSNEFLNFNVYQGDGNP